MPRISFRDRFFTPPVARALLSPWSILLFGAATAAAIVAGLPILVAVVIGAAAYGLKILFAVPKNKRGSRIDPFVLSEPWRGHIQSAQASKLRFDRTVVTTPRGPIKNRLRDLAKRLEDGIDEAWRIATRGDDVDSAISQLNTKNARRELGQLQKRSAVSSDPDDAVQIASTIASLEAQISSGERLERVSASARNQLRLLEARFDELVARAVEVSIGAADGGVLGNDVDNLVTELHGLRLAMDETNRADSGVLLPATPPDPAPGHAPASQPPSPTSFPAPHDGPPEQKPQTWPPR